uniref:long-chain-fatty-acid--CoA ligase n=1 Tax=Salvator merianae TaxID=96440 RepID=A0A8D0E582_SALMN
MLNLYTAVLGLLILFPLWGKVFFPYLWKDLAFLFTNIHLRIRLQKYMNRSPPFTLLEIFLTSVRKHPKKPLILFGEEVYSYQDIDKWSSQVARVFRGHAGLDQGQTVAVFLKNIPAYLWVWMGLEKIGCSMACINHNIRSKSLLHAVSSCEAKVLVTTPDFKDTIEDVLPTLKKEGVRVFYLSEESPTEGVDALLGQIKRSSSEPVPTSFRANVTARSTALYIFTSGTTGLPKAVVIDQKKLLMISTIFCMHGIHSEDITYNPLPLYHVTGLLVGFGGCVQTGSTCVLRSKFSATHYWDDCRRYNVSVIVYVGEIMRYLCNTPKKDNDRDHSVRIAVGNGVRVEVWKEFLHRFGPIEIKEMYGATEGNVGFINYIGKVGAVGRTNLLIKLTTPFEIIQYDIDQDEPVRDDKGLCIPVATGEKGLFVAKITGRAPFHGYAGERQKTEKKILRDVLKRGDCYFNSGDLLMQDHEGFLYFKDRVGDTFRWKGENVATSEVEITLASLEFIQDIIVYGVPVPGHEGKIGMAAIQLKEGLSFDGKKLYAHVKGYLPNYAIPHFIRIQAALELTGTYKYRKAHLVKEGYDPATINDPLFFLDDSEKCYVPMTQQIYNCIIEKKLKL